MSVAIALPPAGRPLPAFDPALLERRAAALLAALEQADAELSVALVGDEEMAGLNRRYRRREGPTDVLSFSLLEGEGAVFRGGMLGDVVIDVELAARQASELGHGLDDEMARLLVHGVLHLLGYDHEREEDARVMEPLERRLWETLLR